MVVDDGSLPALKQPPYDDVRFLRQQHGGASAARNAAIAVARGRFVWFFDADDVVVVEHYERLLEVLRALPDDADLLHTGPMTRVDRLSEAPSLPAPLSSSTLRTTASRIMVPQSACLDHTTYIISRAFLVAHPTLRYPERRSLLEDATFILLLLDRATGVYANDSLRPYCICSAASSVTSGKWSSEQCTQWIPDIVCFLSALRSFADSHHDFPCVDSLFRRYCYLYLRVLAVKGCPWHLLAIFRQQLIANGYSPRGLKEHLLFNRMTLFVLSALCRLLR